MAAISRSEFIRLFMYYLRQVRVDRRAFLIEDLQEHNEQIRLMIHDWTNPLYSEARGSVFITPSVMLEMKEGRDKVQREIDSWESDDQYMQGLVSTIQWKWKEGYMTIWQNQGLCLEILKGLKLMPEHTNLVPIALLEAINTKKLEIWLCNHCDEFWVPRHGQDVWTYLWKICSEFREERYRKGSIPGRGPTFVSFV
jgi:hypothetical protein